MENVCLVKMNRMLEKSEWGGNTKRKDDTHGMERKRERKERGGD